MKNCTSRISKLFTHLDSFINVIEKIRILHLGSPKGLYGAERWILALTRHLDFNKFEPWVASIKDEPVLEVPLCREAKKLGLHTHIFEAYGKVNFSAVKQLRNFVLKSKIHILHTHGYKTDMVGLLAIAGTACKIISTPHGWSKETDIKLRFYEVLDRALFPFFDAVVPLSKDLYCSLRHVPSLRKKLHLINNGVDVEEIDSVKEIEQEISFWKEQGAIIIGYIGQLIERKGLDILLRAVAGLPKSVNWKVVIVGEGPKRRDLEDLSKHLGLSERVIFLGFRSDRIAIMKGLDVFVLPSRLEGIPRCLMEAMASGVPVIASDIPGCTDLVVDRETGLLFPVDDIDLLRGAIGRLIRDPTLKRKVSVNARSFVVENFSAEKMANSYSQLYQSIVKK